jgi:predicted nucleic acid-binding protein
VASADLLLDTDVLIDHLRGRRRLRADGRILAISVITRCELFAGRDAVERVRRFLAPMIQLPVDAAIAELAGRTRRVSGIATPDALVAATALTHGMSLMTRNRRHFDRVAGLRVCDPA